MLRMLVQALPYALAVLSLGLSSLLFYRIRSFAGLALWPLKILAGSLAGFLLVGGVLGAALGLRFRAPLAAIAGAAGASLSALYLWRIATFMRALGGEPRGSGATELGLAASRPRWERDVPFWHLPAGHAPLLCDLWQPPEGVPPTGLAFVYLHSSSWHLADKDLWTRPLFRHLAAQGHVVMDVAYRLCPEVDLWGMLGDARRAIAWMKAHARRYGADPARVVVAGASAGGHLALLAAYTAGHPELVVEDLRGVDTSVQAVVSFYGLADMRAFYRCAEAILPGPQFLAGLASSPLLGVVTSIARAVPGRPFAGQVGRLGCLSAPGIAANLLGGQPHQVPALYDLASPITHAGPHCPPTLLIQGEHDTAVPVAATHALYQKLVAAGVPAVNVVLPHTDHLFDLVLPQISPPARVARAELDRFLAWVAGTDLADCRRVRRDEACTQSADSSP